MDFKVKSGQSETRRWTASDIPLSSFLISDSDQSEKYYSFTICILFKLVPKYDLKM